jgi:hypothetical protein
VEAGYQEAFFRTDKIKVAATFLAFGARLRIHLPLEWNDCFESKEAYLQYLEDIRSVPPKKNPRGQPKKRIIFNFEPGACPATEIEAAFSDRQAEEKFAALLGDHLTGADLAAVLSAHAHAVASACREVLEAREYLAELMKECPEDAKLDAFFDNGRVVKIGKCASDELRAEFLAKV